MLLKQASGIDVNLLLISRVLKEITLINFADFVIAMVEGRIYRLLLLFTNIILADYFGILLGITY